MAASGSDMREMELRTADGRVPGSRGRATRQRLLDTLTELLLTVPYRSLTVVDLARMAEVSPATFYQYFADMDEAILVLADDMAAHGNRRLRTLMEGRWDGEEGWGHSVSAVEGFLAIWDDYEPLLRVVDLKSAEGDSRFRGRRTIFLNGPTVALAEAVGAERDAGRISARVDPMATAAIQIAMLAHVAAHRHGLEAWGVALEDLQFGLARQLYAALTETSPPEPCPTKRLVSPRP